MYETMDLYGALRLGHVPRWLPQHGAHSPTSADCLRDDPDGNPAAGDEDAGKTPHGQTQNQPRGLSTQPHGCPHPDRQGVSETDQSPLIEAPVGDRRGPRDHVAAGNIGCSMAISSKLAAKGHQVARAPLKGRLPSAGVNGACDAAFLLDHRGCKLSFRRGPRVGGRDCHPAIKKPSAPGHHVGNSPAADTAASGLRSSPGATGPGRTIAWQQQRGPPRAIIHPALAVSTAEFEAERVSAHPGPTKGRPLDNEKRIPRIPYRFRD
jgi:hypothetical protein